MKKKKEKKKLRREGVVELRTKSRFAIRRSPRFLGDGKRSVES
jgi:hypothetical protein